MLKIGLNELISNEYIDYFAKGFSTNKIRIQRYAGEGEFSLAVVQYYQILDNNKEEIYIGRFFTDTSVFDVGDFYTPKTDSTFYIAAGSWSSSAGFSAETDYFKCTTNQFFSEQYITLAEAKIKINFSSALEGSCTIKQGTNIYGIFPVNSKKLQAECGVELETGNMTIQFEGKNIFTGATISLAKNITIGTETEYIINIEEENNDGANS